MNRRMITRVYFKHLLVALMIPTMASAAELCSGVLLNRPSAEKIDAAWHDLSNLKYQLDVAQVSSGDEVGVGLLKTEFKTKLLEFQRQLGIDDASLKNEIANRIAKIQNRKIKETKEEARARRALEKSFAQTWKLKSRVDLEDNGNVIWIDAELNKAIVEWDHEGYLVNLKTGKTKSLNVTVTLEDASITRLANRDEVLVQSRTANSQGRRYNFKVLNLRTGKKTVWGEEGLAKLETVGSWQIKRSPDNSSMLATNMDNYYVLDPATGAILKSGTLPASIMGPYTFINSDQIVFNSFAPSAKLHIFRISTGEHKTFPTAGEDVKVLANGDFLFSTGQRLFRYNVATQKTIERQFDRSFQIQGIEGDKAWISTSEIFSGKSELRMIDLKNLKDSITGPVRAFEDEGLQVTHLNEDHMAVLSANKHSNVWGVYGKKTLDGIEWFSSLDEFQIITKIFASGSRDGKNIVIYGEDAENVKTLEIWGRK